MSDPGYFPRGESMLRRVHEHRAVGLLYGQRALAIGALNPLTFVGTVEHTNARARPFQRLVHTAKAFETIFFGTRAEADQVLAFVHRLHERVEGEMPRDAGPVRAGTPYSAFDPELMLWTVAVIADSARAFYEIFVRRLDAGERQALWEDYIRFGELFGMPRDVAPPTYEEFRAYLDGFLASDAAHLSPEARRIGTTILFRIPVPLTRMPAMQVHNLVMLGSLPPIVREHYGLRWTPAHALAYRGAVQALAAALPLAPRAIRKGRNTPFFDEVARTERGILASGRPAPGALA